jgi:hypothetical protein
MRCIMEGQETMEIVDNLNRKIRIPVHNKPQSYTWERILGNKDATPPELDSFASVVPNYFDTRTRDLNIVEGNFRKSYQSGYAPQQMQQRESDTHFIR